MSSQTTAQKERQTTAWTLDPYHTQAEFSVRHLMISNVRGSIPIKNSHLVRDEQDITRSQIEVELDTSKLDSGIEFRDNHLRSADFFDAENHPTMKFKSTRIETVEDGLRVHGDLTIRAITRPVVLEVELLGEIDDPTEGRRIGAHATTTFDRRDFGLNWNSAIEAGGVMVGDKVKVDLNIRAVKA